MSDYATKPVDLSNDESATMIDMLDAQPAPKLSDADKLFMHALTHFLIAIAVLAAWAAADSWYLLTELALANFLSIATAAVAGVVISTLIHEWFHYAGAKFSGSSYRIPAKRGLFVYDFDFKKSSEAQFNMMSYAGQLGSIASVILLFTLVPADNPGRAMLIAGAIGATLFGGSIEWPVLMRVKQSHQPLQELAKITPAVFKRSLLIGTGGGALAWLVLS
jgi:hypothetical protein